MFFLLLNFIKYLSSCEKVIAVDVKQYTSRCCNVMINFPIFQYIGVSGWFVSKIMKLCLHLSKLYLKYCRLFFPDTVYISQSMNEPICHVILCSSFDCLNRLFFRSSPTYWRRCSIH